MSSLDQLLRFCWRGSFLVLGLQLPKQCDWPSPGEVSGGTTGSGGAAGTSAAADEPALGCATRPTPDVATFELLPWPDELPPTAIDGTFVQDVSADGSTMVGGVAVIPPAGTTSDCSGGAIWRNGSLTTIERGYSFQTLSCDGSLVLLQGHIAGLPPVAVWTPDGSIALFDCCGSVQDISADASYVLANNQWWDPARVSHPLPVLPPDAGFWDISADGQRLAGTAPGPCQGTYCKEYVYRATLTGEATHAVDTNGYVVVSSDGNAVAAAVAKDSYLSEDPGWPSQPIYGHDYDDVVIWTASKGSRVVDCPVKPCFARDISSRGNIVLTQGTTPLIWSEKYGFRELVVVLKEFGATISDEFASIDVTRMSDDGRVFVGQAYLASGRNYAYRATLPRAAWE